MSETSKLDTQIIAGDAIEKDNNSMVGDDVTNLRQELEKASEKYAKVESYLLEKETSLTKTLQDLYSTLKTISYNQTVLENKLEDTMKNQMNTDVLMNQMNERINKLSELVTAKNTIRGASTEAIDIHGVSSRSSTSHLNQPSSAPRRGPGRPRKDPIAALTNGNTPQYNNNLLQSKVTLPTGTVQASKSKRYFIEPETDDSTVTKKEFRSSSPPIASTGQPPKRKRGRPPKKRVVETVIANTEAVKDESLAEITEPNSDEEVTAKTSAADQYNREIEKDSTASPSTYLPYDAVSDSNKLNIPVGNISQDKATSAPDLEKTNLDSAEPLAISTGVNDDVDEEQHLDSLQEQELDKRRDDREKMLVNLKYNDRDKAKSFMQSHRRLLQAMKEEERRKRMTSIIFEMPTFSQSSSPPSSSAHPAVTNSSQRSKSKESGKTKQTGKIGISSMLNSEESQMGASAMKRSRSDDAADLSEGNTSMDASQRQLRKRKTNKEEGSMPNSAADQSIISKETSFNDVAGSVLTEHPIELLCRDGLFYRRNMLDEPISTGGYLEFKFKDKEEELLHLWAGDDEKIRHDKINAHFLKPEIEEETEIAYAVLSPSILTEKYVNSLEYFLMEFRWENRLVSLGMKLRESKRTWQRRKALFTLFEFWRDQSRDKRNFPNYTILHAVKEMESYRVFISRSVSWFYNHITLLKMILFDHADSDNQEWREWMFPKDQPLPAIGENGVTIETLNSAIDNVLTLDFLGSTDNLQSQ